MNKQVLQWVVHHLQENFGQRWTPGYIGQTNRAKSVHRGKEVSQEKHTIKQN